jgi:transposase
VARQVHSSYTRKIRDLGLGAHRVTLRLHPKHLRCRRCQKISAEHFDFVKLSIQITKRLARAVAELCKILPLSDVAEFFALN